MRTISSVSSLVCGVKVTNRTIECEDEEAEGTANVPPGPHDTRKEHPLERPASASVWLTGPYFWYADSEGGTSTGKAIRGTSSFSRRVLPSGKAVVRMYFLPGFPAANPLAKESRVIGASRVSQL